ncbi:MULTISPECIES: retropepsin-like aspartic protease [unclassified Caulobacter]|uniref:retropepsin-like aspartic protease n=1 Tax=unclassified Caulobacter TaxID=2648921 RepID=UPI000782CB90|nr:MULTISPECIES: retropepsin-like aspartic protease [unclassified Caulobacter]AZS21303.1 peptidase A2A [Caulobacter sp. FWC26]
MFTRRLLAGGLGSILAAPGVAGASALTPIPSQAPALPQTGSDVPQAAEDPLVILDATLDSDARLTVATSVNDTGGFRFVVDTGADKTVLTPAIAERLNLPRGPDVLVHGASGSLTCPTALVRILRAGETGLTNSILPVLPYERVGADGLLGVDALEGRNVVIDFQRKQLEVRRSAPSFEPFKTSREVNVAANARYGRLTLADSRIGGARSLAFIDSGGGVTIGNMALARAIAAKRRRSPDFVRRIRLLTASGEIQLGEFRIIPTIAMGDLRLSNTPMAFADLHVFNHWGLNDRPAALFGVDVLRLFARVELDFGAGQVLFRLGQGGFSPVLQA